MKKMLALLMALMMALSCFAAVAEEEAMTEEEAVVEEVVTEEEAVTEEATKNAFPIPSFADFPAFTVEENITIDQEQALALLPMLNVPEEMAGVAQLALPIVGNLGCRFTFNKNAQFDLLLKGANVLSAGLAQTEDGFALVSDLIPSYVVTLKNETIQQMVEQFVGQIKDMLGKIDFQALLNAAMNYVGEFAASLQSAVTMGEPETGEFVIEDVTFNTKVPMTVDAKAVAVAAINMFKSIAQDETITATVAQLGGNLDLSGLDEVLANVENATEENTPEITLEMYGVADEEGNSDGSVSAILAVMDTKDEEMGEINMTALVVGTEIKCIVEAPAQETAMVLNANVDIENMTFTEKTDINAKGMYIGETTNAMLNDNGAHIEEAIYFMNSEKPLITSVADFAVDGELTLSFDGEGKTVLAVEELMADEEGQITSGLFMDLLSNGVSSVLSNAAEVMPEEVTALYNALSGAGQEAIEE